MRGREIENPTPGPGPVTESQPMPEHPPLAPSHPGPRGAVANQVLVEAFSEVGMTKTHREMVAGPMLIQIDRETFDLRQMQNRRFMFNPKTQELVLGTVRTRGNMVSESHAHEFGESGATGKYDDYVKGWVGTNKSDYRNGIVHFAPPIQVHHPKAFEAGFSTIQMFIQNGGTEKTIIRGFCAQDDVSGWEQPYSKLRDGLS